MIEISFNDFLKILADGQPKKEFYKHHDDDTIFTKCILTSSVRNNDPHLHLYHSDDVIHSVKAENSAGIYSSFNSKCKKGADFVDLHYVNKKPVRIKIIGIKNNILRYKVYEK